MTNAIADHLATARTNVTLSALRRA